MALVIEDDSGWHLATVQPSYRHFFAAAGGEAYEGRAIGSLPDVPALLAACERLHPGGLDLVAVDMPLSVEPIIGRRIADNLISSAYGARHCSTHSPSAIRPGPLSDALREAFGQSGFPLATSGRPTRALIEVYPHPALVELARAKRRLPYKISRITKYWPQLSIHARRERLLAEWGAIVGLLENQIQGVSAALPLPTADAPSTTLKAFEDQLDAIVCAWIGICVLEGMASAYGDQSSAVWVPLPLG